MNKEANNYIRSKTFKSVDEFKEFSLDEKGGKIKSEEAIDMIMTTSIDSKPKKDDF